MKKTKRTYDDLWKQAWKDIKNPNFPERTPHGLRAPSVGMIWISSKLRTASYLPHDTFRMTMAVSPKKGMSPRFLGR